MSQTETFAKLLREQGGFRTQVTTRILPPRQKNPGTGPGFQRTEPARQVGDCFYFAAKQLAKFIYSKIEERFDAIIKECESEDDSKRLRLAAQRKAALMDDAKSILNEHRNQATDAAIPLFDVWVRDKTELLSDSDPLPEPDTHARDYIVKNVFAMLCKTYAAWLPEFVHEDELKAAEETLSRIALIQREKLESELRNFGFGFKRVVAPQ